MNTSELTRKMWSSVRDDDRPVMLGLFERAYERRPAGAEGDVHYIRGDGRGLWRGSPWAFRAIRDRPNAQGSAP